MRLTILAGLLFTALSASAADTSAPYHLIKSVRVGGAGGFDYVYADADQRRLYIPRGDRVTVYDLDTLESKGAIAPAPSVHGVAIDAASHHAFCSSNPVVMWDSRTQATLKTIPLQGSPDGIFCDQSTGRIFVLSHRAPNVTVIEAATGSILGTIDLGGAPEQAAGDGQGRVFIDVEDQAKVAVVDARAMTVKGYFPLDKRGGTPAGLAMDAKNQILFVACREPANVVMMSAEHGKILAALPIGAGVDAAEFDPSTMEYFSSQRDGTLTVVKETAPGEFAAEPIVTTKLGARTSTLDSKTHRIILITADSMPAPAAAATGQTSAKRRGAPMVPGSFTILMVGRN
jgi:DNA-binding beta-propeller fold protein YncE